MVRHIVMWNLREENKEQNAAEIKRALEDLNGKIEGLIRLEVNRGYNEKGFDLCLYSEFESPEAVFLADREALSAVEGLTRQELESIEKRDMRRADQVLEDCAKHHISILTMQDAAYPRRLLAHRLPL